MSFRPNLRRLLARLRPRAKSVAVPVAMLMIAATAMVVALGLPSVIGPAQDHDAAHTDGSPDGLGSAGTTPTTAAPAMPAGIAPIDQLTAGVNPEEMARQLEDLPAGRWSYAFHATAERPSIPVPPTPPPRRVLPVLPASALGFAWPLQGVVTSVFDDRHPLGIDIAPAETRGLVRAAREGTVIAAGGDPCCGYGYFIMIDHGDGITSIYGHLQETPPFQPGEPVERGTVLGVAGDTGRSFGVHLHFEVRANGVPVNPDAALIGGEVVPLPAPTTTEPPTPPNPQDGDPYGEPPPPNDGGPADDAASPDENLTTGDPAPSIEDDGASSEGDTTSSEPPIAESIGAPPSPTAEPTVVPTPAAVTPSPAAASEATAPPAASPSPPPTPPALIVATSPTLSPAASATPSVPARTPPAPTPTPSPVPPASPSPAPSASPVSSNSPSPAPRCGAVRFPATDGFITLKSDGAGVPSLVAERCDGSGVITVVVEPKAGERCTAEVVEQDTTRRLLPVPVPSTPERTATPDKTRWMVEAEALGTGTVVRVTCHPLSISE